MASTDKFFFALPSPARDIVVEAAMREGKSLTQWWLEAANEKLGKSGSPIIAQPATPGWAGYHERRAEAVNP